MSAMTDRDPLVLDLAEVGTSPTDLVGGALDLAGTTSTGERVEVLIDVPRTDAGDRLIESLLDRLAVMKADRSAR